MKIFAQIVAFGNLLALLAFAGVFLALYPVPPVGPLAAGLVSALSLAVFFGQRYYARFIARRPAPWRQEGSYLVLLTKWMAGRHCPVLLVGGNFVLGAVFVLLPHLFHGRLEQFQTAMAGFNPHPLHYWLLAAFAFQALVILVNISFGLTCLSRQQFRKAGSVSPLRFFFRTLIVLALLALLGWNYQYASERYQFLTRQGVWTGSKTIVLYDGQTIELTPPPGYIGIEPNHRALQKFFSDKFSYSSRQSLLAVFVADQRTYKKIIKNLESDRCDPQTSRCDNRDLAGLAWVGIIRSHQRYAVDPDLPLTTVLSWFPPSLDLRSLRDSVATPAFFLSSLRHQYGYSSDEITATDLEFFGRVIVSGRLLSVSSHYGAKGELDEEATRQRLDHSRQWLEDLSGWRLPEQSVL